MSGASPKLTKGQKREARLAAMERTHAHAKKRAAHVIEEAQAEIERSEELLEEIARLAAPDASGEKPGH